MDSHLTCGTVQHVTGPVCTAIQRRIGSVADALSHRLALAKSETPVEGIKLKYRRSRVSFRVSITAVFYTAFWQAVWNQSGRVSQVALNCNRTDPTLTQRQGEWKFDNIPIAALKVIA